MIRFVADEDFHGAITRGLLRRGVDIVRVQDVQLRGASDEAILDWSADADRVVLTHDRSEGRGAKTRTTAA
jgi:predicted nuclease of predicted toxin-antitoxin system